MSYVSTSLRWRGKVAEAVSQVHQHLDRDRDVSGRIPCPACGSGLTFTIQPNGRQRGHCASSGCMRWEIPA